MIDRLVFPVLFIAFTGLLAIPFGEVGRVLGIIGAMVLLGFYLAGGIDD